MRLLIKSIPLVAFTAGCLSAMSAAGEDFRIESTVYVGEGDEARVVKNLTLFKNMMVYDFLLTAPRETTIYDPRRGEFILLDDVRKVKTQIPQKTLLSFVSELKLKAEQKGHRIAKEAANPRFEMAFDERLSEITLTGKLIHYTAQGQKFPDEKVAAQYLDFADMYARLNVVTRPGALPPFARLQLNQALAERKLIPTKVQRTLKSRNPLVVGGDLVARSEHAVSWRLLRDDHQKIDDADRHWFQYRQVSFGEYQNLEAAEE